MVQIIESIDFRQTPAAASSTTAATIISESKSPTIRGRLVAITIHIPEGSNGLVGIRLFSGSKQIFPRDEWIFLVGTQQFPLNYSVEKSSKITIFVRNEDTANAHTVFIVASIAGEQM